MIVCCDYITRETYLTSYVKIRSPSVTYSLTDINKEFHLKKNSNNHEMYNVITFFFKHGVRDEQ